MKNTKKSKNKKSNPQASEPVMKLEDINKTLAEAWSILEQIDNLDFNKDIDLESIQKESDKLLKKVEKEYKPLIDKINIDDEKE